MGKILSITIPAYNVETYLERCLGSLEEETVMEKIEVLIINDGSKDRTAEIAERYCSRHPGTFFLYNKENGGHGSGINHGIRYATGKYFKVVDGDDWLDKKELAAFVELLEKTDADVVAADYRCIQDGTDRILEEKFCTLKPEQYGKTCDMTRGDITEVIKMHALTIKTQILKEHHVVIDEHCFYVDSEYITYPMPYVKEVYFYHRFIYMYRLGRDGQSMDIRSMQKNRAQHQRVLRSLLDFYDSLGDIPGENRRYIERCIAQIVENQFQIYISLGLEKGIFEELRALDLDLSAKHPGIYQTVSKKSITLLRKTGYRILPIGAMVYRIVRRKRWKKR